MRRSHNLSGWRKRKISGVLLLFALFSLVLDAQRDNDDTRLTQWLLMLLWLAGFNRKIKCQTFAQNTDSFIRLRIAFFFYIPLCDSDFDLFARSKF